MRLILLVLMGVVGSQALRANPPEVQMTSRERLLTKQHGSNFHPKFISDEAARHAQGDEFRRYGPDGGQKNGPFFLTDADHPGAHRKFEFLGGDKVRVTGDDGEGTNEWTVEGELDINGIFALDFAPQGGPKQLTAHFTPGHRIQFDNGMLWYMTSPEKVAVDFNDPNHPLCPRKLRVEGSARVVLTGADQIEGAKDCADGKHGKTFEIKGYMMGETLHMDFSPKGGPKDLTGSLGGIWDDRMEHVRIFWGDGNLWKEVKEGDDWEERTQALEAAEQQRVAAKRQAELQGAVSQPPKEAA